VVPGPPSEVVLSDSHNFLMRSSLCVLQGYLSERLSRPAGDSFSERIAGSAAQIFENLVGREVEVMLLRSVAARKGGRGA
jgi:hypothetical protein